MDAILEAIGEGTLWVCRHDGNWSSARAEDIARLLELGEQCPLFEWRPAGAPPPDARPPDWEGAQRLQEAGRKPGATARAQKAGDRVRLPIGAPRLDAPQTFPLLQRGDPMAEILHLEMQAVDRGPEPPWGEEVFNNLFDSM
jgi:hypothetical protein